MRVMVIGRGGREHALAWRLARDRSVDRVYVAPGNGGTNKGKLSSVGADSIDKWVAAARDLDVGLTVVGPEAPLVAGVADAFAEAGLALLGPSAAAAMVEGSKAFAKGLMTDLGVPTAKHVVVTEANGADGFLREHQPPYAVKADGLAGGKGVEFAKETRQAKRLITDYLAGKHGDASKHKVVVERVLDGREITLTALCDGATVLPLAPSQDHKRLSDGDAGPNTGGMGAVSPPTYVGDVDIDIPATTEMVMAPVIGEMAKRGTPYRGFLYAGLMVGENGDIAVLEYNCRLGDPEAQVLMPRWQGDVADVMLAAARGGLEAGSLPWSDETAVCVVLASRGYPSDPLVGQALELPECPASDEVFHAGTKLADGVLRVAGGRVAGATSWRSGLDEARSGAYALARQINFEGSFMRSDIAASA